MSLASAPAAGWDGHVHVFEAHAAIRVGHYVPAERPLRDIESLAQEHGIGHLVIVQPSVYGTDHAVLLRALRARPGRHRGVAVLTAAASDRELDDLHAAGVRGVRFNLVSPAAHPGDPAEDLRALAPRLRERGWHVQWYVQAGQLAQVAAWQVTHRLTFVLDHLAGLHTGLPDDAPAWDHANTLAREGAWIKLSGWYRLGAAAPYDALVPTIRRAALLFGERTLWGSDWPHTSFTTTAPPGYDTLLAPVRAALGDTDFRALLNERAPRLYLDPKGPP
jgi:predicted TIM-barrel fold metal-dependent hydrolase